MEAPAVAKDRHAHRTAHILAVLGPEVHLGDKRTAVESRCTDTFHIHPDTHSAFNGGTAIESIGADFTHMLWQYNQLNLCTSRESPVANGCHLIALAVVGHLVGYNQSPRRLLMQMIIIGTAFDGGHHHHMVGCLVNDLEEESVSVTNGDSKIVGARPETEGSH